MPRLLHLLRATTSKRHPTFACDACKRRSRLRSGIFIGVVMFVSILTQSDQCPVGAIYDLVWKILTVLLRLS